jgi:hypothetical protein
MNRFILSTALALSLGLAGHSPAQTSAPVGGPDAKGNAPLKHAHTVNDGSAKPGANSFTQGQARQHILNSGYTDVTGLTKGEDGVWRGTATKNGASVPVAMDFKGNVSEGGGGGASSTSGSSSSRMTDAGGGGGMAGGAAGAGATSSGADQGGSGAGAGATSGSDGGGHSHKARRHHRRRHHGRCAHPGPNGAACSGVSTLQSGVSDKETRAMQSGSHP